MLLKLDKYFGLSLCNAIRQAVLTKIVCLRPIGFRVGQSSTVISTSDSVEEDMTEFINGVCSGIFGCSGENAELLECKATANGCLTLSSLISSSRCVFLVSDNTEVLHTLAPEPVTVYFRLGSGCYTVTENKEFLASCGCSIDKITVVSSRHSYVRFCNYKIVGEDSDTITVDIRVEMLDGTDGEGVLQKAIRVVASSVSELI